MKYPLFSDLDADAVNKLLATGQRSFYKAKESVFSQGDEGNLLYLIEDGHVVVKMDLATGDSLSMQVLGPGAFFGEVALVSEPAIRHISVRAVDDATLMKIHRDEFDQFRKLHPEIDRRLLQYFGKTVRLLYEQLAELSSENVQVRLLRRLLEIAELYGRGPATNGTVIPLTQQDMADLAATSRPTASTLLQDAENEGMIKLSRGKIEIVDSDELESRVRRKGH